ncbi:hypothetical protein [Kutzneria sp. CA-103260]|uniref:hypothetical protein n=1 Tax=Kutzneria sp. CA-103260 TaxID=2802641 RepID=UPI001BAB42AF|nr:hypothetical protein [Kutzneria sp. CA-103260]QUQ68038.1 hypothetical protein JJ691_57780 [Kutzneria sp. CA-103260]
MRQTFSRLSKLLALAALVGGSLFGVGAVTASAQPLDGWACSVPAGYTYDQVANQLGVCNPSGFTYSYHLVH